jgi:hypothetical protein
LAEYELGAARAHVHGIDEGVTDRALVAEVGGCGARQRVELMRRRRGAGGAKRAARAPVRTVVASLTRHTGKRRHDRGGEAVLTAPLMP